MGVNSIRELVDCNVNLLSQYRKVPSQVSSAGIWFDLSMSAGIPSPQYYAGNPLESKIFSQSTSKGFYHGGNVSPLSKYLRRLSVFSGNAAWQRNPLILMDYLMFYPFIDESDADEQTLTNSTPLPRYTNGEGVKIMAVSLAARVGGSTFTVNYTNEQGVSGRTTPVMATNTYTANGNIVTSGNLIAHVNRAGPFIPLQSGDHGVRSIESVTYLTQDTGLIALVLVKSICQMQTGDTQAVAEKDFLLDGMTLPEIKDGAYLNFITLPQGAVNATLTGLFEFTWL